MTRTVLAAIFPVLVLALAPARGDDDPTHRFPSRAVHTMERAGYPNEVSRLARPAHGPHRTGGYVGGGRLAIFPRKPDGRVIPTDGTWGTDFVGLGRRPGRVFLDWWHDRPRQPAPGPYRTDTFHVPDVVALHPIQKLILGSKHEEK